MSIHQVQYDLLLAEYSNRNSAIALLKQHRPYLEMIPSMRRSEDSVITIPLPVARVRYSGENSDRPRQETLFLPCDLAILMCDPEWKVKMGVEILVFIHRPHENFSDLLRRWRETQVHLDRDYEWLMPPNDQHIFSEGAEQIHPLFVIFEDTLERIKRGLQGAGLPYIIQRPDQIDSEEQSDAIASEL